MTTEQDNEKQEEKKQEKFEPAKTQPRCPECGQLLAYGYCKCDNDLID